MPTNQLAPPDLPGLFMRSIGVPNTLGPPDLQRPSMQNTPPLAAPPPTDGTMTPADVWSFNRDNLGDAWTAAQNPDTWREAAQNYGQGMLMGSIGPGGKVAPAEAMWDAFDAAHAASGLDKFSHMKLFQHGPSDLEISHVQVDPAMRGQGVGNQLMDMLTNKADEHGVTLHASPASDADPETGLDYDGLREWYQRWGFDPSGSGDRLTRSPAAATQQQPTPGFTAYHGSPHAFDQFDLSKIGTGEGAQAYGHGMYLADSEGVARSYRDQLAPQTFSLDGVPFAEKDLDRAFARKVEDVTGSAKLADNISINVTQALRTGRLGDLQSSLADQASSMSPEAYQGWKAALDHAAGFTKESSPGHMYEVNVNADPAKFLDWDKPLSEQHPDVQAALKTWNDQRPANQQLPTHVYGQRQPGQPLPDLVEPSGEGIYKHFSSVSGNDPAAAAQALHQAGIPGIRYLDQGSRGSGEGTRNSVVFDAATMNIIRRYGLAGLLGGGAAAAATQQPSQ